MNNIVTPPADFSQAQKDAFIQGLMLAGSVREKAAGSSPSPYFVHGPGGILSPPGIRQDVMNAMQLPIGIQKDLPLRLSRDASPVFPIMTGETVNTGSQPGGACDDAKQPGELKVCNQVWTFGRQVMDSQILQADRPGLINNRGEFTDMRLVGDPFTNLDVPQPLNAQEALRTEVGKKLYELYTGFMLEYSPLLYTGDPSNTTGNTGYIEYSGLDKIINTGYQDAFIQQACPAADSTIVNFGSSPITGNEVQIVTDIVETTAYLNWIAKRTGMGNLQDGSFKLRLSMRYEMFRALTQIWPCVYMTYRCTFGSTTNATNFVDANMQQKMRDDMRNGVYSGNDVGDAYLLVDGMPIQVTLDDNITETVPSANVFQSDIYFIPMSVRGGRPVTYMEYFDLNAPGGMRDVTQAWAPNQFEIIGNGRYWLHRKPPTNECVQVRLGAKPRLICETPYLAARLTNVRYSPPLLHSRSPFPNSPYYFVDGGAVSQVVPTFYSPTA